MKKFLITLSFIIVLFLGLFCFYPHTIENAVLVDSSDGYMTMYINGKVKKISADKMNFPKLTVLNYKYNMFKNYDFKEVLPLTDRIMEKKGAAYELEKHGDIALSSNTFFFAADKNSNIKLSSSSSVLVGKQGIKCYTDSKGNLQTFIISTPDYSNMRIGISTTGFESLYHKKIQLISSNQIKLYSILDKFSSLNIPANTNIDLEESSSQIKVTVNNKSYSFSHRFYMSGTAMKITSIKRGNPQFNPSYDGTLEFKLMDKGICMINELPMESYLSKVVPSEMPNSGGIEALKCQAVAARTYAISDMLACRFGNMGFYVDDSTQSQVYNNTPANQLSSDAVNATKGVIMTYNSKPIDAKYYSTSCGTGVRFEDVWFTSDGKSVSKPYFRTVNFIPSIKVLPQTEAEWLAFYKNTNISCIDNISPYYRWHVQVSAKGLTNSLSKTLKALFEKHSSYISITQNGNEVTNMPVLDAIENIKVVKRSTGGSITSIDFVFKNAEITVKGDSYIRSALKLGTAYTSENDSLVLNKVSSISPNNLLSSFFSVEKSGSSFILYGGGYGHGVGMSQYGAMELSKVGWDFKKILNVYYKNVNITSVSEL